MKSMKLLKSLTVVSVLVSLMLFSSGCVRRQVILRPVIGTDLWVLEDGSICMSEDYFEEVIKAKIEREP